MDFTTIYKKYYPQLLHYSHKMLVAAHIVDAKETAEDMVEQSFIKTWEYWSTLQNEENAKRYLYIAVRNHTFNYLQQYKRHQKDHAAIAKILEEGETPDYFAINADVIAFLYEAIKSLPPQCAAVARLFFKEIRSDEIAHQLKITRKTALNQKLKAIAKLREMIILKFGHI